MFREAKQWCRVLREVGKLPLNDVSRGLEVVGKLFPGGRALKDWRKHEVCFLKTRLDLHQ